MTSAARDLMDTGTPCPKHRALGVNPGCGDCDGPYVDGALVLPLVDALIEATKTHEMFAYQSRPILRPGLSTPYCRQCGRAWPCPTATARDALEAALRGDK